MQTETKLLAIEFGDDRSVSIKLEKRVVEGDLVVWREPHRFMLPAKFTEADIDAQVASVNRHLDEMDCGNGFLASFPPLDADRIDRIKSAFRSVAASAPRKKAAARVRPAPKRIGPADSDPLVDGIPQPPADGEKKSG